MDAKAPRKWLLIGREFGVPSEEGGGDQWSLDHLFLDQDAIPTISGQMDPAEVLAVEIKQFVGQGLRSLVPRVIGQTAEALQKKVAQLAPDNE